MKKGKIFKLLIAIYGFLQVVIAIAEGGGGS